MNNNKQKAREQIDVKYKWNIGLMYPVEAKVYEDINESLKFAKDALEYQGKIMLSSTNLLEILNLYSKGIRLVEKAYVYSHMKHDEDNSDSKYIEMFGLAVNGITQFTAMTSFITPEILESDTETIKKYINENNDLKVYEFMLEQIMLGKNHTLNKEQEYIIASLNDILSSSSEIFTSLNDVDMNFGELIDIDGENKMITHASYSKFLESESRDVRKKAYYAIYEKYKELNNTLATIYRYSVQKDVITSKLRKYNTTLDAYLSPYKISTNVYDNLIAAVNKHLPSLHKYIEIKKNTLAIDDFKMYDIYKPLVKPADFNYSFEDTVDLITEALKPLGDEYVSILRDGLLNERWVDVYENAGKTSGAFSFGSYDSLPYILMNFTGDLRDAFTLIHESGHSMHSYYTRKTQPYIYGDHSIFTAEVASTVNETLLIKFLLNKNIDKDMRTYLINFYLEEFKSTLFRQTMFAEFEKIVHEKVENGETLTADYLNSIYNELNIKYYGNAVHNDDMIQYEWSRIPHFYNAYYVYQYATGFSAANAIANKLFSGDESAKDNYLKFLTTGSSDYPIELLKIAGVDMNTEYPILSALDTFDKLVDELDAMLKG